MSEAGKRVIAAAREERDRLRIEALEAENARLRVRVKDITIVAERALNEWEGLINDELVGEMYDECMKDVAEVRAALSQDNPQGHQCAGDQADDT